MATVDRGSDVDYLEPDTITPEATVDTDGDSTRSTSASIASSIMAYKYENGYVSIAGGLTPIAKSMEQTLKSIANH